MPQRRAGNVHELRPGRLAAVVLAPSHLARVLVQVDADPVVLADLGPAQPREERLGLVGVRALVMEGDAVVDPPGFIEGVQRIP
jgi:hypothetical protein